MHDNLHDLVSEEQRMQLSDFIFNFQMFKIDMPYQMMTQTSVELNGKVFSLNQIA